jgi:acyl dehydratase
MTHELMVGGWRRAAAVYSQLLNTRTENVLELQHFEDLPLGGEWTTRRRTVTEADVAAFVGLAGDYNPLYTDLEHARSSQYGGLVAPGALVAALATGLGSMDVPLPATIGLVGMSWKFLLPVQPGDTLGSRWRLSRKRNVENPRWGLAVWQVDVENQRGEMVASAEVTRLVSKREQPVERTGRSRRRRRKGAPAGQAAADVVLTEPVPEPAPADLPTPAARRRRRRGPAEPPADTGGQTADQPAGGPAELISGAPSGAPEASPFGAPPASGQAPQDAQPPEPAQPSPAGPAPDAPPSRRRRRRRPSNGQEEGRQGGEGRAESRPAEVAVTTVPGTPPRAPGPAEPARPPEDAQRQQAEPREAPEAPLPSPFRSFGEPDPEPGGGADPESGGGGEPSETGLGRVFRRLRRP